MAASTAAQTALDAGFETRKYLLKARERVENLPSGLSIQPGIKVTRIKDVTPIPHNGCRPPKKKEFNKKK